VFPRLTMPLCFFRCTCGVAGAGLLAHGEDFFLRNHDCRFFSFDAVEVAVEEEEILSRWFRRRFIMLTLGTMEGLREHLSDTVGMDILFEFWN